LPGHRGHQPGTTVTYDVNAAAVAAPASTPGDPGQRKLSFSTHYHSLTVLNFSLQVASWTSARRQPSPPT